jgi:hypothetical protein
MLFLADLSVKLEIATVIFYGRTPSEAGEGPFDAHFLLTASESPTTVEQQS